MLTADVPSLKPVADRTYDVVLVGATGFVGKLAAEYLAKHYGSAIKWAIAGRRPKCVSSLLSVFLGSKGLHGCSRSLGGVAIFCCEMLAVFPHAQTGGLVSDA